MWALEGPFDIDDLSTHNRFKLLRPGQEYTMGRGRHDDVLVIRSKKISATKFCTFIVGEFSEDDVSNPAKRPKLQWIVRRTEKPPPDDKATKEEDKSSQGKQIARGKKGGEKIIIVNRGVNANSEVVEREKLFTLESDDSLLVSKDFQLHVRWIPVICYVQRGVDVPLTIQTCASLGIHIARTANEDATHHIASSYACTNSIIASLLTTCPIVKPDWLNALLKAANDTSKPFELPPTTKFRPSFSQSLKPEHKVISIWEPNEERLTAFLKFRFIYMCEHEREIPGDLRIVLTRGRGTVDRFDIYKDIPAWHAQLKRTAAKEKIGVVVADTVNVVAAVGKEKWEALVNVATTYNVAIVTPQDILHAVLSNNLSTLEAKPQSGELVDAQMEGVSQESFATPDIVPNTYIDEPTVPPPTELQRPARLPPSREDESQSQQSTRKRPIRRATSQVPEVPIVEPLIDDTKPSEPPTAEKRPRRALTRRAGNGIPQLTGVGDDSLMIAMAIETEASEASAAGSSKPVSHTPGRRKLTRRADTESVDAHFKFAFETEEQVPQSRTQKFKTFFQETDPSKNSSNTPDFMKPLQNFTQTQTQQTQSGDDNNVMPVDVLAAVPEEEEEGSQTLTLNGKTYTYGNTDKSGMSQGTKRKADDNVEMEGNSQPTKKRALEGDHAVEAGASARFPSPDRFLTPPPPGQPLRTTSTMDDSPRRCGAEPGKPDTDEAFLTALASTKRGKRIEDDFDREFNKLKISKPDPVKEERELKEQQQDAEWKVLEEFGEDGDLRGNFMTIVMMDVNLHPLRERVNCSSKQWAGRPNFKKFKKKVNGAPTKKPVELVLSEGNEKGAGEETVSQDPESLTALAALQDFIQSSVKSQKPNKALKTSQNSRRRQPGYHSSQDINISDEDDEAPPPSRIQRTQRVSTRASSRAASVTRSSPSSNRRDKNTPLFLDASQDNDVINSFSPLPTMETVDEVEVEDLLGNPPPMTATSTQKSTPLTQKSQRTATRKRKATVVEEGSDDELVFGGFSAGTTKNDKPPSRTRRRL